MLNYGYYNVAAATIDVQIGDVEANTEAILKKAKECREQTDLLVFPELCISGYTCGDLFFESALLDACEAALERLCENYLLDVFRRKRYELTTVEPIIGYLLGQESQIAAIRAVMVAQLNGLDRETLGERLRELYV